MANEMRLIDAKDFDLRVSQRSMTEIFPNWKELPEAIQDMLCEHGQYLHMLLETQPTVDAVEVVRCKHCKSWKEPWLECQTMGRCLRGKTEITSPDHFCSYGERRTEHESLR